MKLTLDVSLDLNEDEERQLASILRADRAELEDALQPVAAASLEEYVRMFLGQKVFTRGRDVQDYRLFLLIRELFDRTIPDEERVCALFQTTESQSRSLIRSVLSKYQYEVHEALENSLSDIVRAASQPEDGNDYQVAIYTEGLVEGLNRLLADEDGSLPQVSKKRGTVSTYQIKPSSYAVLRERLGVKEE